MRVSALRVSALEPCGSFVTVPEKDPVIGSDSSSTTSPAPRGKPEMEPEITAARRHTGLSAASGSSPVRNMEAQLLPPGAVDDCEKTEIPQVLTPAPAPAQATIADENDKATARCTPPVLNAIPPIMLTSTCDPPSTGRTEIPLIVRNAACDPSTPAPIEERCGTCSLATSSSHGDAPIERDPTSPALKVVPSMVITGASLAFEVSESSLSLPSASTETPRDNVALVEPKPADIPLKLPIQVTEMRSEGAGAFDTAAARQDALPEIPAHRAVSSSSRGAKQPHKPSLDELDDDLHDFAELETMSSPCMRQRMEEVTVLRRQFTAPTGRNRQAATEALRLKLTQGRQVLTDRALEFLIGGRSMVPKLPMRTENPKTQWGKEWVRVQQTDGVCQICFEPCSTVKRPCGNLQCSGQYCNECLNQTALSMIEASLYACPYLKCPECRNRVPTLVWRSLVPEEAWEKYCTNARALLNFRCPDCDEVGSLLAHHQFEDDRPQTISAEEHSCWMRWGQDITSVNLIETIVKAKTSASPSTDERAGDAGVLAPSSGAQRHFYYLLLLVDDIERRCTLLLQWLRRFPYFKTPCCESKMCFKCKTQGWHPGRSCEERMRKTMGSGASVQWCPQCGVPTVKSEGCDHIVCCCGASWTWMRSSLLYAAIHGLKDHLVDALAQQVSIIKIDVETEEDLNEIKRITDNWRLCHPFRDVPAGAELLRATGTACEGLTNIAYLKDPCHLWFRPRQESADEEEEEEDEEESSRAIAYAAIAGSSTCVKILIEHGYDPNHTSYRHSHTPLCAMVAERARRWGGDAEPLPGDQILTSKVLVSAKADINLVTNYGETPLTLALQEQYCPPEFLDWLLDNSDFSKVPGDGLFHCLLQQQPEYPEEEEEAVQSSDFAERFELRLSELVVKLSRKNAQINQIAQCGETPLMLSCERGLYKVTERLLDNKAMVEPPPLSITQSQSLLRTSAIRTADTPPDDAYLRLVRATRNEICTPSTPRSQCSSAPILKENSQQWQLHIEGPLEAALRANNGHRPLNYNNKIREQLVQLLLEHGACANRLGVLNQAVSQSGVPIRCVELLLEYNAEINTMDDTHTFPLFAALEAGHTHMANLLLERKAEINVSDSRCRNIFHVVATGDYTWESELPWDTDNPPDVPDTFLDAKDASGHTPLFVALRNMMTGVTAWLLNLNADANEEVADTVGDGQMISPLAFAIRQRGLSDMCRLLLAANAFAPAELLSSVVIRCDQFAASVLAVWPLEPLEAERKTSMLTEVSSLHGDCKEDVMKTLLEAKGEPTTEMFLSVLRNPTKGVNACCRLLLDYGCVVNAECLTEAIFRGHANLALTLFQSVPPYPMTLFDICRSPKLCEKDQLRLVEAAMDACDLSLRDSERSLCCTYAFERKRWDLGLKLVDTTDEQLYATVTALQEKRAEEQLLRKTFAEKKRSHQTLVDLISEAQMNILHNQALLRRLMPSWTMIILCAVVLAYVLPKEMQRVVERFQKATYWWERPSYLANQVGGVIPKNAFEKVFRLRYWNIIERPFHSSAFCNSIRNFDLANVPKASIEFVTALRRRMTPQTWHSVTSARGRNAEALLSDWLRCVMDFEERTEMKKILTDLRHVGAEVQAHERLVQTSRPAQRSVDDTEDDNARE